MSRKSLLIQQLNSKMERFSSLGPIIVPPTGWIKAIRTTLGMSMQQLGYKLNISKQAVLDIEKREKEGSITIRSLREVARAMDMQLVYAFVPNDGSLDALIERRANELARQIVMRTAQTMTLEGQANSVERIENAVHERAEALQREMPRMLWD